MAWRISLKASWTLAVCLRENSTTSTASHTMWFWQIRWNQKVSMPTAAAADFRVPQEEPRGERLAVDLSPAGRIDEEAEHVLLSAVQAGRPVEALGRRLEIGGDLLDHVQQVGVVQPRVAGRVDRAEVVRRG